MEDFLNYIQSLRKDRDIPSGSGYMPDKQLGPNLPFFDLHPVLRALLIADGTVTMAIEAIYREPIEVVVKQQESVSLKKPVPVFGLDADHDVYYRAVALRGKLTGKHYVDAYSLLKPEAIPKTLWQQLAENRIGMGAVMRNASQGNFREVLHFGCGDVTRSTDTVHPTAENPATGNELNFVHRTYLVSVDHMAAIIITEVFNVEAFSSGYK